MGQKNTALLIMDMEMGIIGNLPHLTNLIKKSEEAIQKAKEHNYPIFFIRLFFRPGLPEINPKNKFFSGMKERIEKSDPEEFMKIHPDLHAEKNGLIIEKKRVSAFSGNDLEIILRVHDISHIVLSGVSTSGIVLSTVREASDKDFKITVLSDACADRDETVHQFLVDKIFPRQADVITVEEWE